MSTSPLQLTPAQLNSADTAQWKSPISQESVDLRVAVPAIVQSFDAEKQFVTVQIAIREQIRTPYGPQNTEISPLYCIPIAPFRAGGFAFTLPIQAGDEGFLIFCDMAIDLWKARGGVQNQLVMRRHDLNDSFFLPGGWSQPRVLENYSTTSAQLRSDDGSVVVDVAASGITLTAPKVTINSSGDVDITAQGAVNIQGNPTSIDNKEFLTHLHSGVQSGGSDTGPVV